MKLKKVHEDERRDIYSVEGLLQNNKEFTIIRLKKGKAIGGCIHSEDEYFCVVDGDIDVTYDFETKCYLSGMSDLILRNFPHMFVANEDSIVLEWGVDKSKPENNLKDKQMREEVNKINGL